VALYKLHGENSEASTCRTSYGSQWMLSMLYLV